MTAGAVRARIVVLGLVFDLRVTCEAFRAEEIYSFFGRWRDVRVMTIHARHARAAGNLAPTGVELLDLADSAASGVLPDVDEVRHEIVEVIAWLEVEYRAIAVFNAGVAFEMTDATGAVSLLRG